MFLFTWTKKKKSTKLNFYNTNIVPFSIHFIQRNFFQFILDADELGHLSWMKRKAVQRSTFFILSK